MSTIPSEEVNLLWRCKLCPEDKELLKAPFQYLSNLKSHLNIHSSLKDWLSRYQRFKNKGVEKLLSDEHLTFIKFFIASNISALELNNVHLQKLCANYLKIPSEYVLTTNLLPMLMEKLCKIIEEKLENALVITLIVDIWTNKIGADYIAVAASTLDSCWVHEVFTVGMMLMPGPHNAENIKIAIEVIINKYEKFDKSKIQSVVCDEGSSLVRLFSQLVTVESVMNTEEATCNF